MSAASVSSICAGASADADCEWSVKLSLEQWRNVSKHIWSVQVRQQLFRNGNKFRWMRCGHFKNHYSKCSSKCECSQLLVSSICAGASTTLTASGASTLSLEQWCNVQQFLSAQVQQQLILSREQIQAVAQHRQYRYRRQCYS